MMFYMARLCYLLTGLLLSAMWISSVLIYLNRDSWLPEKFVIKLFDSSRPDIWVNRSECFWVFFWVPMTALGFIVFARALMWLNRHPEFIKATKAKPVIIPGILLMLAVVFTGLHILHLMRILVL